MSKGKTKTAITLLNDTSFKKQVQFALPKHLTADRIVRIATTELKRTPLLQECDPLSVIGSVIRAAQLGLEPGSDLGHAYLIPYKDNKKGIRICQFILGYRGMIDLAHRSGKIITVDAESVSENDDFYYEYGSHKRLKHIPVLKNKGETIAFYGGARFKNGHYDFKVIPKEEVDKIRDGRKTDGFGPWITHYSEMGKKTAIRRMFKTLPVSIEMTKAIILDEQAEVGIQDNRDVIDLTPEESLESIQETNSTTDELIAELGNSKKEVSDE